LSRPLCVDLPTVAILNFIRKGAAAMRPPAISSNNLLSFVIFILIIYCIESAVTENLPSLSFVLYGDRMRGTAVN